MAARSRTWLLLALALASGGLAAYLALRYLREQAWPLLNQQPVLMAEAMKHAIVAGRMAYLAGRMPKKLYASASSPLDGLIK